jgi:hypothetical protein
MKEPTRLQSKIAGLLVMREGALTFLEGGLAKLQAVIEVAVRLPQDRAEPALYELVELMVGLRHVGHARAADQIAVCLRAAPEAVRLLHDLQKRERVETETNFRKFSDRPEPKLTSAAPTPGLALKDLAPTRRLDPAMRSGTARKKLRALGNG